MPGHEKLLKKVEQDRAKGQYERALAKLKEAIAADPSEFALAQEAAGLCFALGRTLEGAGILRSAMKRCPGERPFALDLLEREFATSHPAELGEILYESYLALPDLDRAREVVVALAEPDRGRLLVKLQTKIASVTEEAPDDAPRLTGLLLAEAIALSAMQRSAEFASTLERALDLEPAMNDTAGRLSKLELRQSPDCAPVHLLLARCYLNIQKADLAAEHAVAAGKDAAHRERALQLLDGAIASTGVDRARAELLLLDGQFDAAHAVLRGLLDSGERVEAAVRHTFEAVPGAVAATPALRLLYAQALARTGTHRPALKELQDALAAGADPRAALAAAELLQTEDARNVDLMVVRGRCAIAAREPAIASAAFKQALETDPSRAAKVREEIEAACADAEDPALGRLLVDLYLQLESPQEAAIALRRVRDGHGAAPDVLYDLAGEIASRYGFSATLLLVFVEAAAETAHGRDARAAVAHYLGSPGAHTTEFAQLLAELLQERPQLAPQLGRVLDGLALPVETRFQLATGSLDGDAPADALVQLETLALERPELREPALAALEAHLTRHSDDAEARLLAADLCEATGRTVPAMQHLASVVRSAPAETDRVCKLAEKALRRDPKQHECWRDIVLALVDAQRHRHARELCYLAQQMLPRKQHGFVHVALGEMLLASDQQPAGVTELESALACEDVPLDRVVALLDRVVEADNRNGYARYVLASALLRQGADLDRALVHLSGAVQQDDLLVDLAFELLADYAGNLAQHAPARVLEGLLRLRKGERARGVELLGQALELQPQIASQVLLPLEAEWDRDPQNTDLGLTFAQALRGAGQTRRACRLVADLARRCPDRQAALVAELESMLEGEPLPEAHRALWEILLERGDIADALPHLQAAIAATHEPDGVRELLEAAARRVPDEPWVVCRLAQFECAAGRTARAEELLCGLLARDSSHWKALLDCVRGLPDGARTEGMQLFEIDCLLAGQNGVEALDGLQRFRVAFPAARNAVVERYRRVVDLKSAGLAAELELGGLLREAGQVEEAVAMFEAGLERAAAVGNTTGADAVAERELRLTLAQLYVELGRETDGKHLLSSVLEQPGDHQETYGFLERLARQGMLSRLKSLRTTIASYPGNLRARLELARLSIVSMDFEGAREALSFTGDSTAVEAARRYLLARSHADEDHPDLALAVLRSIELDDVADEELRRNVVYLKGVCCEALGQCGEAHGFFLQILSEFPYFKDTRERVRRTYQKHLESALGPRAEVLEKRTHLDVT